MGAARGREPKIAIVGATGTVGGQLLELIEEHGFLYSELQLFADEEALVSGEENGNNHTVARLGDPSELAPFDIAFLAVPGSAAAEIIRAQPGPMLIDLSGAGISVSQVPPIAPGLTPRETITRLAGGKVFSIADPAAHVLATIIRALRIGGEPVSAALLVSASSVGRGRIQELAKQSVDLMNARLELEEGEEQLAFSVVIPEYEREVSELISTQVASLLGRAPNLTLQILLAPIFHGAALTISVPDSQDVARARDRLRNAPGLLLLEDSQEMRSTLSAVGQEAIIVHACDRPHGLALYCFYDNARLAALLALWAAENLASGIGTDPV
jgi:aspartate-semialdehyde dehydrogenase